MNDATVTRSVRCGHPERPCESGEAEIFPKRDRRNGGDTPSRKLVEDAPDETTTDPLALRIRRDDECDLRRAVRNKGVCDSEATRIVDRYDSDNARYWLDEAGDVGVVEVIDGSKKAVVPIIVGRAT